MGPDIDKGEGCQSYSFKDSLLNTKGGGTTVNPTNYMCLEDKDVRIITEDGTPQISFSDRVHGFIADNMKNTAFLLRWLAGILGITHFTPN